jgi:hypothetical protein
LNDSCDSNIISTNKKNNELALTMFVERKFIRTTSSSSSSSSSSMSNQKPGKHSGKMKKLDAETQALLNNTEALLNRIDLNAEYYYGSYKSEVFYVNAVKDLVKKGSIKMNHLRKHRKIKLVDNQELNPNYVRLAPMTDEQLIRIMGGTLRHAASSIFVTSFTTAAAFLTNLITKLPPVQLFGLFTGLCILVYFSIVITVIAAFVITYEKYIQQFDNKLKPKFARSLERIFEKLMDFFSLLNYRIIIKALPRILIKLRLLWFILFTILGIIGLVIVFYSPKLRPPANWRYQFFQTGNLMENFEFHTRDKFWSYVNEEKRNLTNPEIFFVFGIIDKDTGRLFNPDDDGHLLYDKKFDFLTKPSQVWLHKFISQFIASRPDLFLAKELVDEWITYLYQMQQYCYETLNISSNEVNKKIFLPFEREKLSKCRDEINGFLVNSSVENFENLMSSFPRRIIFMTNGTEVVAILLRVNANRTFIDYDAVQEYFSGLSDFHKGAMIDAPDGFNTGWFISVAFALYDLQYQLTNGTYSSLVASMLIAWIILLLTSQNFFISLYAIITISFTIADTVAIFVLLGWNLSILESIVIIMSVGLSVDFSCHYGVAYIKYEMVSPFEQTQEGAEPLDAAIAKANNLEDNDESSLDYSSISKKKKNIIRRCFAHYRKGDKERFKRIGDIFNRVGSAVLMAALTTFLAGLSMYPSGLTSFSKMGQFLMLVMGASYLFATFYFIPFCALFGPTGNFGSLKHLFFFLSKPFICKIKDKPKDNANKKKLNSNEKHKSVLIETMPTSPSHANQQSKNDSNFNNSATINTSSKV